MAPTEEVGEKNKKWRYKALDDLIFCKYLCKNNFVGENF